MFCDPDLDIVHIKFTARHANGEEVWSFGVHIVYDEVEVGGHWRRDGRKGIRGKDGRGRYRLWLLNVHILPCADDREGS